MLRCCAEGCRGEQWLQADGGAMHDTEAVLFHTPLPLPPLPPLPLPPLPLPPLPLPPLPPLPMMQPAGEGEREFTGTPW